MYAQYLRFLPVAGLRFTFYAFYPSPESNAKQKKGFKFCMKFEIVRSLVDNLQDNMATAALQLRQLLLLHAKPRPYIRES